MKLMARNLARDLREHELHAIFAPFGEITSCDLVLDKATGRSKGFGFIVMPKTKEAVAAMKQLNTRRFKGSVMRVKIVEENATASPDANTTNSSNAANPNAGSTAS